MARGRAVLGVVIGIAGVGAVSAGGAALWAKTTANGKMNRHYEAHRIDFPIPFPLSDQEIAELREERRAELPEDAAPDADPLEGVDLAAIASERAVARGEHLVKSRYACSFCHGADFGGGVMIDDPMIGSWRAPNITAGGRTASYTAADWDRSVRHGVLPDGRGSVMPTSDFVKMSDHELADVVSYIRSLPVVEGDNTPKPTLGPLGTVLVATGKIVPDVAKHDDHMTAKHPTEPPETAVSLEFGEHLAQICTGCHREGLMGGPMPFGPPDWPPAGNLTPSDQGLAGWTYEDFERVLTTATRPDGTMLRPPMRDIPVVAINQTETERHALWMYLQSLPPTPTGE